MGNPFARKRKNVYDKKDENEAQAISFAKKKKDEQNEASHENPVQRSGSDAVWMMNRNDEKKESTRGTKALVKAIETGNVPMPPSFTALTSTPNNIALASTACLAQAQAVNVHRCPHKGASSDATPQIWNRREEKKTL